MESTFVGFFFLFLRNSFSENTKVACVQFSFICFNIENKQQKKKNRNEERKRSWKKKKKKKKRFTCLSPGMCLKTNEKKNKKNVLIGLRGRDGRTLQIR